MLAYAPLFGLSATLKPPSIPGGGGFKHASISYWASMTRKISLLLPFLGITSSKGKGRWSPSR